MKDLVERLREGVADTGTMINTAANVNQTMSEAADLIEQLQAQNAMMQASRSEKIEQLEARIKEQDKVLAWNDTVAKEEKTMAELKEQIKVLEAERDEWKDSAINGGNAGYLREQIKELEAAHEAAYHASVMLTEKIKALEAELNTFQQAVAHVTEDGKTRRSFSSSEGWAMVHHDRLSDLEIAEEQLSMEKTK
jgi:uncharacterized coiled-coil protein SlyX